MNGSVNVPLFIDDDDRSFSGLLKQAAAYGTGGWWLGGGHMKSNPTFIGDVQAKIPKDKPVLVACQKGLRSLNACEQLVRAVHTLKRACACMLARVLRRVPSVRCAPATPRWRG